MIARGARLLLLLLGLALLCPGAAAAQRRYERFDPMFRKYSKRFFGVAFDWRLFKAQGLAESNLDPDAASRAGARGIMQLMPSTFAAIQSRNPQFRAIDDEEWNIAAGILHDRLLWRQWSDSVETAHQHYFMFASYNAGRAPIVRAQALARSRSLDPRLWTSIEAIAGEVPRWRHRETLGYVRKIDANLARMDARGRVLREAPGQR